MCHSGSAFALVAAGALCEMEHSVAQEPVCLGLITASIGFEPVDDVGIQAHGDWLFYRPVELADFCAAPVENRGSIGEIKGAASCCGAGSGGSYSRPM